MSGQRASILDALGNDELLGREIRDRLRAIAHRRHAIALYVALARLEDDGLIVGKRCEDGQRRYRRAPAKAVIA